MATLISCAPHLLLRRVALRRPAFSLLSASLHPVRKQRLLPFKTTPFLTLRSFVLSPVPPRTISLQLEENCLALDDVGVNESERGDSFDADESEGLKQVFVSNFAEIRTKALNLSVKEKKDLASYAHSLGKKLKSQQVGKSGVTDTVVTALIETLERNELLKLKIHGTCPGELDDVLKQLEEATGSVIVGQIGRTVILYRPSLSKLKKEEKKKQMQTLHLKRQSVFMQSPKPKSRRAEPRPGLGEERRQFSCGRRGRSRF